ncbi:hypothetical protein B0H14DRAFT_2628452 [Mycena olivaceomarginata]|nr:hypothetical protein B0H14DRAFT_2628452 [Mycena olivaceomarginata]
MKTTHGEELCDIQEGREGGGGQALAQQRRQPQCTAAAWHGVQTVQCERPIVTQCGAVSHGTTGCGKYRARGSRKGVERAVGDEKGDVWGGCKWWQSRPSSWTQKAARSRHESAECMHEKWRGRIEKKNLETECERETEKTHWHCPRRRLLSQFSEPETINEAAASIGISVEAVRRVEGRRYEGASPDSAAASSERTSDWLGGENLQDP